MFNFFVVFFFNTDKKNYFEEKFRGHRISGGHRISENKKVSALFKVYFTKGIKSPNLVFCCCFVCFTFVYLFKMLLAR